MASAEAPFPKEARRGRFVRQDSAFRGWVSADGSSGYAAEPGRYHLYVSLACPWAHRTVIVRMLKGLENVVSMSVVDPIRDERGWRFGEGRGFSPDPVNDFDYLAEAYLATDPRYHDRVTVPVLWDRQTGVVVNNESAEIIRMLAAEFDAFTDSPLDLYPLELRAEIDEVNARVYDTVNNGVYRAGFATSQEAYDEAVHELFASLDWLEERLADRSFLVGEGMTEADWRLLTTLVRFDPVYVGHFKCNLRRIVDYPAIAAYAERLLVVPGVAATVDMDHIRRHYHQTHRALNPYGIVPAGPVDHVAARAGIRDVP
ncbi:MAG: glutathione S-transferase family protein [Miltoncostaeaceae bacterium]